jgi:hypothetical protein
VALDEVAEGPLVPAQRPRDEFSIEGLGHPRRVSDGPDSVG